MGNLSEQPDQCRGILCVCLNVLMPENIIRAGGHHFHGKQWLVVHTALLAYTLHSHMALMSHLEMHLFFRLNILYCSLSQVNPGRKTCPAEDQKRQISLCFLLSHSKCKILECRFLWFEQQRNQREEKSYDSNNFSWKGPNLFFPADICSLSRHS